MSTTTAFAVHGSAFQAEFPADFLEEAELAQDPNRPVERDSSGAMFRNIGNSTHTFYAVVPSPSVLVDYLMTPTNIFLYYATNSCIIRTVNVFDGSDSLGSFNVNWSGNQLTYSLGLNEVTLINAPSISKGLIISVDVDFAFSQTPGTFPSVLFGSVVVNFASGQTWYANLINAIATKIGRPKVVAR
jgi:hypothetical protein